MTLLEILIVLAVLAVLAVLLLPALSRPKHQSRLGCVNNLKQVTLAFKVWSGDNGDKYPMEVSTNNGGTREFVGSPNTFVHFLVMSNELNTPKLLFCPQDTDRTRAQAWTWHPLNPTVPGAIPYTGNTNLSYFVGIDATGTATDTNSLMFLVGDRNITDGIRRNNFLELTTNTPARWTSKIHNKQGNVGLADMSVQSYNTPALQKALAHTGVATNRLAMP
jgi:hypothetical protein